MKRYAPLIALAVLLAGCNVAPKYQAPAPPPAPAAYKEESKDWKVAQPADAELRGDWWSLFR